MSEFLNHLDVHGIAELFLRIAAVFVCIIIHEVSHGYAAYRLGDPTAKDRHRLSLNPVRHIDPVGLLMMVVAGFGWAKPVPVNPKHFKNPKSGMAITALAGPLSNFVLAFFAALICNMLLGIGTAAGTSALLYWLFRFFTMLTALSIGLGIFNLIPFPPLDGYKILSAVLPEHLYFKLMQYERYGMLVLLALVFFGRFDRFLMAAIQFVWSAMMSASEFVNILMISLLG